MSTDETTAIVKHLDHIVKIKDSFSVLEEDFLAKAVQLPKSLSKPMHFSKEANPKATAVESTPTCVLCTKKTKNYHR